MTINWGAELIIIFIIITISIITIIPLNSTINNIFHNYSDCFPYYYAFLINPHLTEEEKWAIIAFKKHTDFTEEKIVKKVNCSINSVER